MTSSTAVHPDRTWAFDADTAVHPAGEARWRAQLTDRWDRLGGGPLGGYTLAVALRALEQHAADGRSLSALAAFFHRPASHGDAAITTETARTGRRFTTAEARLAQSGREVLRVIATYADLPTGGRTLVLNEPPLLPSPEACVDPLADLELPGVTIADRVEYRFAQRPGWATGTPTGEPTAECWLRFTDDRPADLLSLPLLVDAAAPAVLEIGALGSSTIELSVHLRAHPAPGWLALRIATRHVINDLHEEDVEIWDSTGQLVAQSRQLAILA